MNRPKATRLGLSGIAVIVAACAAFVPGLASGDVSSVATATYGPTDAVVANPIPGSTTDYQIDQTFTYDDIDEDLKKWIVDSPAGLVGNPNAIAKADRCTMAEFDPSGTFGGPSEAVSQAYPTACPASSRVGFASLYTASDGKDGTGAAASIPAGTPLGSSPGTIFILDTPDEVPTTLATVLAITVHQTPVCNQLGQPTAPCTAWRRTTSLLAPTTNRSANNNGDTDFRIRTVPNENVSKPVAFGPTGSGFPSYTVGGLAAHVTRIDQHLYSHANQDPSNPRFLTMPARLDSWQSFSYSTAWNTNSAASLFMDPNNPAQPFSKSAADSDTPAPVAPPYGTTVSSYLSTGQRDAYPALTVRVADPAPAGHDQPKILVTTLPEAVSVNVNALNNVCSVADRDANSCPAAAQIGTATIKTPLISAGLSGRVYMTKSPNASLPYLSIFVDGPVKFRLDATTKFVGSKFNMIETTFDNLPQTPFTDFAVNIAGGSSTSSLLYNRACPTDGSEPPSGSTWFNVVGYGGQAVTSSSENTFWGCFGASNPSKIQNCVTQGKQLKVTPKGIIAKPDVAKVTLRTGTKKTNVMNRATDRKATFKFKLSIKKSKYKKNKKYYYGYKIYYKDGNTVKTKTNTFKVCKTR